MKLMLSLLSLLFGMIASVLVYTPYFDTPPLAITIFALLGTIAGIYSLKEKKALSIAGIILSAAAFLYLVFLFIQLGG